MYKPGDSIILIEDFNGYKKGEIFIIKKGIFPKSYCWWGIPVKGTYKCNNWMGDCPFVLYKKRESNSEIEFLNKIQENFKYE